MSKYIRTIRNLMQDESGQDMIEYALVASLIGLAATTTMGTLASDIAGVFTALGNKLNPPS